MTLEETSSELGSTGTFCSLFHLPGASIQVLAVEMEKAKEVVNEGAPNKHGSGKSSC